MDFSASTERQGLVPTRQRNADVCESAFFDRRDDGGRRQRKTSYDARHAALDKVICAGVGRHHLDGRKRPIHTHPHCAGRVGHQALAFGGSGEVIGRANR